MRSAHKGSEPYDWVPALVFCGTGVLGVAIGSLLLVSIGFIYGDAVCQRLQWIMWPMAFIPSTAIAQWLRYRRQSQKHHTRSQRDKIGR